MTGKLARDRNIGFHNNWETPEHLYNKLNKEFNFDFDPCPLHSKFDGLAIRWGKRNFVNPPYSRKEKEAFIDKAIYESKRGAVCVLLIPVSTSSDIFHSKIFGKAEIRFIKRRVQFIGENSEGKYLKRNALSDSMIVIFGTGKTGVSLYNQDQESTDAT